jgi:hypothetical protein
MKSFPSDDRIREAHAVFDEDHDRLRNQLISALTVVGRRALQQASRTRRITWTAVALVASLLALVSLAIALIDGASRPVYALDGIHERLRQVRSLHVKGWTYYVESKPGKEGFQKLPFEWYAERPSRYWHTFSGITDNGAETQVQRGSVAADGDRKIFVNDSEKSYILAQGDRLATEMQVEEFLQNQWSQQLVHGLASDYQWKGSEKIDGRETLRYECVRDLGGTSTRSTLWLSPTTGLPVRSETSQIDASGKERPLILCGEIATDVAPRPEMFAFQTPPDYRLFEGEKPPPGEAFIQGSAAAGKDRVAVRSAFAIDRLAMLVSWNYSTAGVKGEPDRNGNLVPDLKLVGSAGVRDCELHSVATQTIAEKTWNWCLAIPQDRRPLDETESLNVAFIFSSGSRSSFTVHPLRLNDQRLSEVFSKLQEGAPAEPAGATAPEPFTLLRVRWRIKQILTSVSNSNPEEQPSP